MIGIPPPLEAEFERWLRKKAIHNGSHSVYKKWVRFYLGFCHKYGFSVSHEDSLPPLLRKLQEKRQTKIQQDQAGEAIGLLYLAFEERASAACAMGSGRGM